MPMFRKKPVVIEAVQLDGTQEAWEAAIEFVGGAGGAFNGHLTGPDRCWFYIDTLEGQMTAKNGDWIIKGVNGEFYPCKPDIFAATYEAALSPAAGEDDALPRPLWPVSKEWYRLCERRFAVDRITISGKLAEAIVEAMSAPAVARNEGEVDWRWQYRFQTIMRFMDNGATREAAERAADIDVAGLERAASSRSAGDQT